ncbi:MAG TPA: HigA family addiction module antitoxin [Chitinophagaceae bacterium]|jgi:addiction module HigA family antidote|nr:HigA family addiction module antitoxin [Chitinophagaceae bacterium]
MSTQLKDERELLSKPGDTILETLEHIKMSQAELAERMGKTPSKVNDIISGKEPITVTTALQLEKVLNIDAQFWLNREMKYREKLSRIEQEEALEECVDWLKQQPVRELKKCGYIKSERIGTDMVAECLQFYGVASPVQWHLMYVNDYAKTNFRKSEAHQTALGSMAAWLRIGEIEMRKLDLPDFNKEAFKKKLSEIKPLIANHPDDFAKQLQEECISAGVALIYTMCLPKAPVSGATRWIGGNPLIQLTDRYKANDHFWFTFYHEAGHVLLHGKKDIFIEEFEGYQPDKEKEDQANTFARNWLLPEQFNDELPFRIVEEDVMPLAEKYNTHPAVVVGRLQYLGLVSYSFGSKFKEKVTLENYFGMENEK